MNSTTKSKSFIYEHPVKIKLEQVKTFLAKHFGAEVTKVEEVGRGMWSKAFFFRRAGKDYVIRFGKEDESYKKDQIATKYSSEKLPVPTVTEVGIDLEYYFAISERFDGTMISELSQNEMEKMIPAIMDMLNTLRQADISMTKGYGSWNKKEVGKYPSWRDFLLSIGTDDPTSRINGWRTLLESSSQGISSFNKILEKLKTSTEKSYEGRHLVHTDLVFSNVLSTDNKISAVIDWGNAIYGDFLYDLATFTFLVPWIASIQKVDWVARAKQYFKEKEIEIPNFEERLYACELHIGLAGMAENAYLKNWKELELTTKRVMDIAESFPY